MFLENIPLAVLIITGFVLSLAAWWLIGIMYLGYTIFALLFFTANVCTCCAGYYRGDCPSGFHKIARFFKPLAGKQFKHRFKRYTPVLYPIWFLPPVIALVLLVLKFSWIILTLLLLFSFTGFFIIPFVSSKLCGGCSNAECCPQVNR